MEKNANKEKTDMEILRKKLHDLIENNASYEEIYKVSVELDYLIEKHIVPLEKVN